MSWWVIKAGGYYKTAEGWSPEQKNAQRFTWHEARALLVPYVKMVRLRPKSRATMWGPIEISKMTDTHLINTIAWIDRAGDIQAKKKAMLEEIARRALAAEMDKHEDPVDWL